MGTNGVIIVLWTLASVLAVGCWNVMKFVVTKASGLTIVKRRSAGSLEPAAAAPVASAQRASIDLL